MKKNIIKVMSKCMAKTAVVLMTMSMFQSGGLVFASSGASDINGHWAQEIISSWQEKGLIGGYEDGTFKPDNAVTRAEFVRIINGALGFSGTATKSFSDIKESDWFYADVMTAVNKGYANGFEDNTFGPNQAVTRAQASVFISKALNLQNDSKAVEKFTDKDTLPEWAVGSIGAVSEAGYTSGYPDGSFQGLKTLTRAEAVSIVDRVINEAPVEKTDDVTISVPGTVLKDQIVAGNLIISEEVGDGDVTLDNVTVKGDIIIKGGGKNSIHVNDTTVEGTVSIQKESVRVVLEGKSSIDTIEALTSALVESKGFTGNVSEFVISASINATDTIVINVPVDAVVVQGKSYLKIESKIGSITIEKEAKGVSVVLTGTAQVSIMTVNAAITITGTGTIEKMNANASGIVTSIKAGSVVTATGVEAPTKTSSGGGGGGGGGITVAEEDKYDYWVTTTYKKNGTTADKITEKYTTNETVRYSLVTDFYDDNKSILLSELSSADGFVTKLLMLESDNGNSYAQSIARDILNSAETFTIVDKVVTDKSLLERIENGTSTVADIQDLAEKIAGNNLDTIETDICTLYGNKKIGDSNYAGLNFEIYSLSASSLVDVSNNTLIKDLKSTLLAGFSEASFYQLSEETEAGKTIAKIGIGNSTIELSIKRVKKA